MEYDGHMAFIIAAVIIIAVYLWSACLIFYREEAKPLVSDESKCFDPACRSIAIKQGADKAVLMIHGFPTTPAMYTYASESTHRSSHHSEQTGMIS